MPHKKNQAQKQPFWIDKRVDEGGRSQDGGGVGRGGHFLPHKFIKRAFKCRVNSTKQLLRVDEENKGLLTPVLWPPHAKSGLIGKD